MARFILQRLVQLIPVLFLVSVVVFILFRMVPGDPAILELGDDPEPEVLSALRHQMRLDRPLYEQFALWFADVIRGDLGQSSVYQEGVGPLLLNRLVVTFQLAFASLLLGTAIGVSAGCLAAWKRDSWLDLAVRSVGLLGYSTPRYWLAILLVFAFSVRLKWLPVTGYIPPTEDFSSHLRYLVLPAVTMAVPIAAVQMRFLRSSLLDVLGQDYVRTARAKGVSDQAVLAHHALRNALIPLVTAIGLQAGYLIGGSIIVEQIFAWPGLGWLTLQAITQRDYSVVQGAVLLSATMYVTINLIVDLSYSLIDPRIRHGNA